MVFGKPMGKNRNGEDALSLEEQASCGKVGEGQRWWN